MYTLTKVYFDASTAAWALFLHLVCWFNFFCLVRTFSNSVETMLTVLALASWPWPGHVQRSSRSRGIALVWAALSVIIRPTSAVLWIYLGFVHLFKNCHDIPTLLGLQVIPIAAGSIAIMLGIDYVGYGEWVLVPLNFVRFNVLEVHSLPCSITTKHSMDNRENLTYTGFIHFIGTFPMHFHR